MKLVCNKNKQKSESSFVQYRMNKTKIKNRNIVNTENILILKKNTPKRQWKERKWVSLFMKLIEWQSKPIQRKISNTDTALTQHKANFKPINIQNTVINQSFDHRLQKREIVCRRNKRQFHLCRVLLLEHWIKSRSLVRFAPVYSNYSDCNQWAKHLNDSKPNVNEKRQFWMNGICR